jgi:hypothetical protein
VRPGATSVRPTVAEIGNDHVKDSAASQRLCKAR